MPNDSQNPRVLLDSAEIIRDRLTALERKIESLSDHKADERDCIHRHERTNVAMNATRLKADGDHERMISLTGIDGKNGRVGTIEKKIETNADDISEAREKTWKIVVVVVVLAITSSSATAIAFRWLGQ